MSAPVLNKVPSPQIDAAAITRSKPLQSAGPPLGGLLLGVAVLTSFLIHGALLGTVLVAEPRPNPLDHVESVTVELVPDTQPEPEKATPAEPPKPAPEPQEKPTPRLEIPDFNQMIANQEALQQASPPKPASAPTSAPAPAPSQPSSQSGAAPAEPGEPSAEKAAGPTFENSPQDALSAAARIADMMNLPEMASLGVFDGKPSETKAKLTADEIAAFQAELRKCWTAPTGIPAGQNPRAVIRIALKRDGHFDAQPQLLAISSPTHGLPVFKNAMEALAKCQPYRSLPAGKYAEWKLLDLQFTARDVAGAAPVSNAKAPPKP